MFWPFEPCPFVVRIFSGYPQCHLKSPAETLQEQQQENYSKERQEHLDLINLNLARSEDHCLVKNCWWRSLICWFLVAIVILISTIWYKLISSQSPLIIFVTTVTIRITITFVPTTVWHSGLVGISRHDNQCTLNDIKCFACLRSISFVVPVLDLTKNSSLHILTTLDCCHFMYCSGMFPPKSLLNLLPLLRIKKFLAEKASIFVFPVVWKDIKWLRRGETNFARSRKSEWICSIFGMCKRLIHPAALYTCFSDILEVESRLFDMQVIGPDKVFGIKSMCEPP